MSVFVLDQHKQPLMPCSEKRARLLLSRKRAVVHRIMPFTIRRHRTDVWKRAISNRWHSNSIQDRKRLEWLWYVASFLARAKSITRCIWLNSRIVGEKSTSGWESEQAIVVVAGVPT